MQPALHESKSISLPYKLALQVALQVLLMRLQSYPRTQDLQPSDISLIEVLAKVVGDRLKINIMANANKNALWLGIMRESYGSLLK